MISPRENGENFFGDGFFGQVLEQVSAAFFDEVIDVHDNDFSINFFYLQIQFILNTGAAFEELCRELKKRKGSLRSE